MAHINNGLQTMQIGHPKLPDEYLTDVATHIKKEYRIDITDIVKTEEGYEFKEEHGFTAGELTYDKELQKWDPLFFNKEIYKLIANKERSEKNRNKRKFTLLRNGIITASLTTASIAALIGLGVIKLPKRNISPQIAIETELSDNKDNKTNAKDQTNTQNVGKNILNGEDLLLLEWMENTITQIPAELSEEAVNALNLTEICTSIYSQALTEYDIYLDNRDSLLPPEMVKEPMENAHNNFRTQANTLNEHLKAIDLNRYTFENSPYSNAIITDNIGEPIENKGTIKGELLDESRRIMNFYDKENYKIFVKNY